MNLDSIFSNFIQDMQNVYEGFVYNWTKANPDKFQFIILGSRGSHTLQIGDITTKSSPSVTFFITTIDYKLNFIGHCKIVKKAYYKLYSLRRLRKFLSLFNAKSKFAYCPLIWMFSLEAEIQRFEKVQYKTLHVVYNSYMATYDELLPFDHKLMIHQRYLQFLAIEIYKAKNRLNPSFMWKTHQEKNVPY